MRVLALLAALIFVCGCVTSPPTETTTSVGGSTPETPTTVNPTTSTKEVATTTETPTTTVEIKDSKAGDCSRKDTQLARDACYLSIAVNTGDTGLCDLIESSITKSLCIENTQVESDGKSTTIEGYVVDKVNQGISNALVYAVSKEHGIKDSAETNSEGFYRMKVPSGDTYEITVEVDGREYKQEVYSKKNYIHEIWFRL